MADIFISYKRQEREKARAIAEMLVMHGYDVWWDIELLPGDKFSREIDEVIKSASAAIVLWSKRAVESNFVRAEAHKAYNKNILIPVRLDDCELPIPFNTSHTMDLSTWDGSKDDPILEPLVRAVEKKIGSRSEKIEILEEIEDKAARPKSFAEIEYWKSIAGSESSTVKEYKAYINKYGKSGIFYDLAKVRIEELNPEPKPNKTIMAGIFTVLALILIILAALYFTIDSGSNSGSEPTPNPRPELNPNPNPQPEPNPKPERGLCYGVSSIDDIRNNLFEAIKAKDSSSVKDCANKLNTVNFHNLHGHSPLASAAFHGSLKLVRFFVSRGAKVNMADTEKGMRRTPLHYAVMNGHKKVAVFLICKNAARNARDSKGKTPFDYDSSDSYKNIKCR